MAKLLSFFEMAAETPQFVESMNSHPGNSVPPWLVQRSITAMNGRTILFKTLCCQNILLLLFILRRAVHRFISGLVRYVELSIKELFRRQEQGVSQSQSASRSK